MEKMFVRIGYDPENDTYVLYISSDGGNEWTASLTCPCVKRENDQEEEPYYVHVLLIEELRKCINLGYKVVY